MEDSVLIRAKAGDRTAQGQLLNLLADPWYRLAVSMLGNTDLARDAAQECALRFLSDLQRFRGDSSLKTWAMGIAINVVREFRRGQWKMRLVPEDFDSPDKSNPIDQQAEQTEEKDRLRQLLTDLPERQREALVLRFFEDLSVEETAKAMGCAQGTIKATVHQALRALKEKLTRNNTQPRNPIIPPPSPR